MHPDFTKVEATLTEEQIRRNQALRDESVAQFVARNAEHRALEVRVVDPNSRSGWNLFTHTHTQHTHAHARAHTHNTHTHTHTHTHTQLYRRRSS